MRYSITIDGEPFTEEDTITLANAQWPMRGKAGNIHDAISQLRMMGSIVIAHPKTIVGIDNGLTGGIVILSPSTGEILASKSMPTRKRNGKNEIDVVALRDWLLAELEDMTMHRFVLEKPVGSKSLNAAKSMEGSYHAIRTTIEVLGGNFSDIPARTWQKAMLGKTSGDSKSLALARAITIWPFYSWLRTPRCTTPDMGLVDAALIAEYTRKTQ